MSEKKISKTAVEIKEEDISVQKKISISGTKKGLLIEFNDEFPFQKCFSALKKEFKKAPLFFRNSIAQVGYHHRKMNNKQKKKLRDLCTEFGLLYQELASDYKEDKKQANSLLITRTLRSGQKVEYNGHIVILGDVQPGAEVAAAGHILIWGALRGVAHAGAAGDEKAIVCAMKLIPVQLRIANFVAVDVNVSKADTLRPEIAFIKGEEIVAEEWDAKSFVKMGVALEG